MSSRKNYIFVFFLLGEKWTRDIESVLYHVRFNSDVAIKTNFCLTDLHWSISHRPYRDSRPLSMIDWLLWLDQDSNYKYDKLSINHESLLLHRNLCLGLNHCDSAQHAPWNMFTVHIPLWKYYSAKYAVDSTQFPGQEGNTVRPIQSFIFYTDFLYIRCPNRFVTSILRQVFWSYSIIHSQKTIENVPCGLKPESS